MRQKFSFLALLFSILLIPSANAYEDPDLGILYNVTMVRAAPGELEALINFYRGEKEAGYYASIGEAQPMIMRHSQGDHWDLFLLQPVTSYQAYYSADLISLRAEKAGKILEHDSRINDLVVFEEHLMSYGPDVKWVNQEFSDNGYFHLELFAAIAGMHDELLDQRVRENAYLQAIGRKTNMIFVGDQGSDIDVFTIGFYKNLQDFAKPSTATPEQSLKAAVENGFKSNNHIGFNLREFLAYHHDTLANKVE